MTTQTTHTPGPWKADKWAPGWTVSAPDSHYSVCHLEDCNNAEANAALIASAPDLLRQRDKLREVLAKLLGEFESRTALIETCDMDDDELAAMESARAILAETEDYHA